jgi:hypothetical protein
MRCGLLLPLLFCLATLFSISDASAASEPTAESVKNHLRDTLEVFRMMNLTLREIQAGVQPDRKQSVNEAMKTHISNMSKSVDNLSAVTSGNADVKPITKVSEPEKAPIVEEEKAVASESVEGAVASGSEERIIASKSATVRNTVFRDREAGPSDQITRIQKAPVIERISAILHGHVAANDDGDDDDDIGIPRKRTFSESSEPPTKSARTESKSDASSQVSQCHPISAPVNSVSSSSYKKVSFPVPSVVSTKSTSSDFSRVVLPPLTVSATVPVTTISGQIAGPKILNISPEELRRRIEARKLKNQQQAARSKEEKSSPASSVDATAVTSISAPIEPSPSVSSIDSASSSIDELASMITDNSPMFMSRFFELYNTDRESLIGPTSNGQSLLEIAIRCQNVAIVNILIGAQIFDPQNTNSHSGTTMISVAILTWNFEIVKSLLNVKVFKDTLTSEMIEMCKSSPELANLV